MGVIAPSQEDIVEILGALDEDNDGSVSKQEFHQLII